MIDWVTKTDAATAKDQRAGRANRPARRPSLRAPSRYRCVGQHHEQKTRPRLTVNTRMANTPRGSAQAGPRG